MAISFVGSASAGSTDGSDPVIDLSGLSLQEGDYVLVNGGAFDGSTNSADVLTSGYSEIGSYGDIGGVDLFSIQRKFMGATPDSSITCEGHDSSAFGASYTAFVFRGVDPTTPEDVAVQTQDFTFDPPSVDPVTDDCMVAALSGSAGDITAGPSGYSGFAKETNSGSTQTISVAGAYNLLSGSAAEDPDSFTGTDPGGSVTIALRPAAEVPSASGSLKAGTSTISGSALRAAKASGAIQAQLASIVAEASRTAKAQGTPKAQAAVVDGSATSPHTASGAPKAGAAVVDGAASRTAKASGALESGAATTAGAVTRTAKTVTAALASGLATIVGLISRGWGERQPDATSNWTDASAASSDWTDADDSSTDWSDP